jgi:galactokinase
MWKSLYPFEQQERQQQRYDRIGRAFRQHFPESPWQFFSVPGRTELGGNHTDHNQGNVLAASINLDVVAAAGPSGNSTVTVFSEGYTAPFRVSLDNLGPLPSESGTSAALIRGIAARLRELGYAIGGFNAWVHSEVLSGSGLSSSASVEVLFGTIFNHLFNKGQIRPEVIAQAGQFAENIYFGKPCGLMDQTACAGGGIVHIDFEDPVHALIREVHFDFTTTGYRLAITDTGGSHADLTADYAAIPAEMKAVAQAIGQPWLRKITWEALLDNLPLLRQRCGDRAILRAIHFLEENERVGAQAAALESGNFQQFLSLVRESGASSLRWLQNGHPPDHPREQGIPLALALSERFIATIGEGACRVHGGGFAGTILAFLPANTIEAYTLLMEKAFGKNAVTPLHIRSQGAVVSGPNG